MSGLEPSGDCCLGTVWMFLIDTQPNNELIKMLGLLPLLPLLLPSPFSSPPSVLHSFFSSFFYIQYRDWGDDSMGKCLLCTSQDPTQMPRPHIKPDAAKITAFLGRDGRQRRSLRKLQNQLVWCMQRQITRNPASS